jgi:predicted amidophosphoribosyltransferase
MSFVTRLIDFIFPPRDSALMVRHATIESVGTYTRARVHEGAYPITTLLPYRVPSIGALIREAKFKNNAQAHALLGKALGEYLSAWHEEATALEDRTVVIIPIPLSRARHAERGYNQVERIARAALPSIPQATIQPELLARVRDTVPQTSLGRAERHINVRGAFTASGIDPLSTYVVLDDVLTTGATLEAATHALREAGAMWVVPLALTC